MDSRVLKDGLLLRLIFGLGAANALVMFGEVALIMSGVVSIPDGYTTAFFTSIISVAGLLYGGYWTQTNSISPERYRRLTSWCFTGAGLFLVINLGFMLAIPPESPLAAQSWVRWAISLGGAIGLALGLFEARAVERAVEAERSRLRRQEIQQERDRLDEFAGIVSHDLRNPLTVASTRLTLAQDECESEHLDGVAQSVDRMEELIDDLLTLARDGQTAQETESLELDRIVRRCWATVETGAATCEVTVDQAITADESRLRQLLENLIRNAIEHGGEDVTVRVCELSDGFYIEDTGTGIPEEIRDSVFETGYSTTHEGTGFGLSIVEEIADAHGWEITATAAADGGARFEITGVEIASE